MLLRLSRQPQIKGFTLIETLVSLIIVGVLAAIATPSLLAWYNNKKIEDVTAQVFGALEVARSGAIRQSTPCAITLQNKSIVPSPASCVPAQFAPSAAFVADANANIATEGAGGSTITFSPRGTITIVEDKSVIVIYDEDAPTQRKMKCIVVSSGVGLMRQGDYTASNPPASDANVDDVEAACFTPD